jgi:hypothetical protein
MGAGNLIEIARVRDAVGCRELLERARQYDRSNDKSHSKTLADKAAPRASMLLQTVASLIHDFGRMKVSAEEGFEMLEQIRGAAIEGFEKVKFSAATRQGVPANAQSDAGLPRYAKSLQTNLYGFAGRRRLANSDGDSRYGEFVAHGHATCPRA